MIAPITSDDAPRPVGAYSQAVRAGDFVFISGQVPRAPDGTYRESSVAEQTRQAMRNVAALAQAAGAGLADLVKVTAYLVDVADFAEFDGAYAEFVPHGPPARTTVVVGLRGVRVEIDATLYVGDRR